MNADAILRELVGICPEFREYWDRENHFQDTDHPITECGVFSQFTGFFGQRHQQMRKVQLEAIAALIGRCEQDSFLADAAYTCFLENIAGDPPDGTLSPYLSPAAREYMSHWRPQA